MSKPGTEVGFPIPAIAPRRGSQTMSLLAYFSISQLFDRWQNATATDYGVLAIAIIVVGWFVSKYYGD